MKLINSIVATALSIFASNKSFAALYDARSKGRLIPKKRNLFAIGLATLLFLALFSFILIVSWQRQDISVFVKQHPYYHLLHPSELNLQISPIINKVCSHPKECRQNILSTALIPYDIGVFDPTVPSRNMEYANLLIRAQVPKRHLQELRGVHNHVIFSLPRFRFEKANVFVNGRENVQYLYSTAMAAQIPTTEIDAPNGDFVEIDVLLELYITQSSLFRNTKDLLFFISNPVQYQTFEKILTFNDNLRKNWLSDLSRVIMAIFLLVIFLFVDSSAETLGMALFLGFECFASTLDYGWLNSRDMDPIYYLCMQMSAIFKLYFVLQLARVVTYSVGQWLIGAFLISVPYMLVTNYVLDADTHDMVNSLRDLSINIFAILLCSRAALFLIPKKLYWRVAALMFAAFACLQQSINPIEALFFPMLTSNVEWVNLYYFMTASSPYLLAISAFVNISSLESRVRHLAKIEAKNQLVEEELKIARDVQQALTYVSEVPKEFGLSFYQDSQLAITGDCYHVHWDQSRDRLLIIVNDITGNGIQAALKASSCQAIARMIMDDPNNRSSDTLGHRFLKYEEELQKFFKKNNHEVEELYSFIGAEFDPSTGRVAIYRANFTFPIAFTTKTNAADGIQTWTAEILTTPNRTIKEFKLRERMFLGFLSDGFVAGSRDIYHLLREVRKDVAEQPEGLSAGNLNQLVLAAHSKVAQKIDDDRTLIVCQWLPSLSLVKRDLDQVA